MASQLIYHLTLVQFSLVCSTNNLPSATDHKFDLRFVNMDSGGQLEVQSVARSNFAFSNALHEQLINNGEGGNLVFSPFSLGLVLLAARFGARGETGNQLDQVLNPNDRTTKELDELRPMRRGFFRVLKSIETDLSSDYKVTVANRLFTGIGFNVNGAFKSIAKATLDIKVKQLNFTEDGGRTAAEAINSWVANKTDGKINNVISPGALQLSPPQLLMMNAVHFKAPWEMPFEPENTQNASFHFNPNKRIRVAMMKSKEPFEHGDLSELNAHAVVLPYQGKRYSMHVYIPKTLDGLNELLSALKNTSLQQIRGQLVKPGNCEKVELSLPKFKIQSEPKLVRPLVEMGAPDMFSSQLADFSGISEDEKVYVTNVVQKAYITVDEWGTEAAASSYISAGVVCSPSVTNVRANRPFYFQIVDEQNDMVIFAGTVRDPNAILEMDVEPTELAINELENPPVELTVRPTRPTVRPPPVTTAAEIVPTVPVTRTAVSELQPQIVFATYGGGIKAYSEVTKEVRTIIDSRANVTGVTWDSINQQLYYSSQSTIYSIKMDTSDIKTAIALYSKYGIITGLDIDFITGNLYVVTEGGYVLVCKSKEDGSLYCLSLLTGQGSIYGVAVDPTHGTMYWTANSYNGIGSIQKASLDGSSRVQIVTSLLYPSGIVVDHDASRILWTEYNGNLIQSSNLNGRGVKNVVRRLHGQSYPRGPWGIAVLNGRVYWGDYDSNWIRGAAITGEKIQSVYVGSPVSHLTVALGTVRKSSRANHCEGSKCPGICALTPTYSSCLQEAFRTQG